MQSHSELGRRMMSMYFWFVDIEKRGGKLTDEETAAKWSLYRLGQGHLRAAQIVPSCNNFYPER